MTPAIAPAVSADSWPSSDRFQRSRVLPPRAGPQQLISGVLAFGKLRAMLPTAAGRVLGQFPCPNRGVTKSHSAFVTEAAPVERILTCPSVRRHARG